MDWILTIAGFLLLGIVLTDFIFTTLSGNGSGKISNMANQLMAKVYRAQTDKGRVWVGALHLIGSMVTWVVLLFLAGLLVFSGFDDMVVNSSTKEAADLAERIYYTGFVISTLGTGDYVPGSDFSRFFTVFFTVVGFGVLTTAITYIISVMGAATNKKNLATFISSMGRTPLELYDYFTTTPDAKLFNNRIDDLVELLNVHTNNQLCYPIVHYFLSDMREFSASTQLASLHEATMALRITHHDNAEVMAHLKRMDHVVGRFLELARMSEGQVGNGGDLRQQRLKWQGRVPGMLTAPVEEESKKRLGALLEQAGRNWEEVYEC